MQVGNTGLRQEGKKDWYRAVGLVLAWILILSMARDLAKIRDGFKRVESAQDRLEVEREKNQELKKRWGEVQKEDFQEKLIRERLNMQKDGEVVVVMPKKGGSEAGEADNGSERETENWEKWLNLLW